LDGFSTTAPIVSVFNADSLGALNQGTIDAGSLTPGTGWGILKLPGGTPAHPATAPSITACLDCASSPQADGGTANHPQRLQFVPTVPLDERTQYGVYITTNVTDATGKRVIPSSAFALLRSANPLFDGSKSTVDLISDAQAQQLEPLRAALKPLIDGVASNIGGRSNLALAWAFTTQSEVSSLKQVQALPQRLPPPTANPLFLVDVTSQLRPSCPTGCLNINIFIGEIPLPLLVTGPGGVFNPSGVPQIIRAPFLLTVPTAAGAYPVTVYGHGLQRARTDLLQMANTLGVNGEAAIATDVVFHGDRSTCIGTRVLPNTTSDNDACANSTTQMCAPTGRCIARDRSAVAACTTDDTCLALGQGFCHTDGKCEGGSFALGTGGVPAISGWNFLNLTNLFATRDSFRQQVIDLTQLTRVIAAPAGTGSLNDLLSAVSPARTLDPTRINYAGQSLGGILGTLYTSVAPDVHNVVLNVPGADPGNILLTSQDPQLGAARAAFIATLAGQGITQGSIAFDTFIGIAKWILDPADPQNMAFSVLHGANVPVDRKALVQYITQDQVIPNPTTVELLNAGNRMGVSGPFDICLFNPSTTALPLASRHGFLLNFFDQPTTVTAQNQLASYIVSGTLTGCP
jgi:pimeloyl-ACP methyl ester carboxylesterase